MYLSFSFLLFLLQYKATKVTGSDFPKGKKKKGGGKRDAAAVHSPVGLVYGSA